MTFSIVGRCAATGAVGLAVTSSSPCVAARCAWVRAGVGAVSTQNVTNPALGPLGLDLLARGLGARSTRDALVEIEAFPDHRQIVVLDRHGRAAVHSGALTLGTHAEAIGADCAAAGNLLADTSVPGAIVDAFVASSGEVLAERLLRALEAGLAAGGEAGEIRSAGLQVAERQSWPSVDLRVDWHRSPLTALREVWVEFSPQAADYVTRALDPEAAPSYGVPGNL